MVWMGLWCEKSPRGLSCPLTHSHTDIQIKELWLWMGLYKYSQGTLPSSINNALVNPIFNQGFNYLRAQLNRCMRYCFSKCQVFLPERSFILTWQELLSSCRSFLSTSFVSSTRRIQFFMK